MQNKTLSYNDDRDGLNRHKGLTVKQDKCSSPVSMLFYVSIIASFVSFGGLSFLTCVTKGLELMMHKIPYERMKSKAISFYFMFYDFSWA